MSGFVLLQYFLSMSTSSNTISNTDSSNSSSDSNGSSTDTPDPSSSSDDGYADFFSSSDEDMLSEEDDNLPEDARLERRTVRWPLSSGMLGDVFGTSEDVATHWIHLPDDIRESNWIDEVRMTFVTFQELLGLIENRLDIVDGRAGYKDYAPNIRLFMTLSFLAHAATMRYMRSKFGVPQNTISVCILRPTVAALKAVLVTGPEREIRFPKTDHEQLQAIAAFAERWHLPGVIGAIDGSLILMRKPSRKQGGNDTDGWLIVSPCSSQE